jgi:hypothetical protein
MGKCTSTIDGKENFAESNQDSNGCCKPQNSRQVDIKREIKRNLLEGAPEDSILPMQNTQGKEHHRVMRRITVGACPE